MTTEPWRPLSRRIADLPPDPALCEGSPDHLWYPLHSWADRVFNKTEGLRRSSADHHSLRREVSLRLQETLPHYARGEKFLDAIDAILFFMPPLADRDRLVAELEAILATGASAWRVNHTATGLERRLDDTVSAAATKAATVAPPTAGDHLLKAWQETYGRHPDPDSAYREIIRAVEEVACPLVLARQAAAGKATLGSVLGELRANAARWQLALPAGDGQPRDVQPLIAMLETLWEGQVSRHAGGPHNRRQTQAEAEAAVHLAATVVQWLSTGVLRRL